MEGAEGQRPKERESWAQLGRQPLLPSPAPSLGSAARSSSGGTEKRKPEAGSGGEKKAGGDTEEGPPNALPSKTPSDERAVKEAEVVLLEDPPEAKRSRTTAQELAGGPSSVLAEEDRRKIAPHKGKSLAKLARERQRIADFRERGFGPMEEWLRQAAAELGPDGLTGPGALFKATRQARAKDQLPLLEGAATRPSRKDMANFVHTLYFELLAEASEAGTAGTAGSHTDLGGDSGADAGHSASHSSSPNSVLHSTSPKDSAKDSASPKSVLQSASPQDSASPKDSASLSASALLIGLASPKGSHKDSAADTAASSLHSAVEATPSDARPSPGPDDVPQPSQLPKSRKRELENRRTIETIDEESSVSTGTELGSQAVEKDKELKKMDVLAAENAELKQKMAKMEKMLASVDTTTKIHNIMLSHVEENDSKIKELKSKLEFKEKEHKKAADEADRLRADLSSERKSHSEALEKAKRKRREAKEAQKTAEDAAATARQESAGKAAAATAAKQRLEAAQAQQQIVDVKLTEATAKVLRDKTTALRAAEQRFKDVESQRKALYEQLSEANVAHAEELAVSDARLKKAEAETARREATLKAAEDAAASASKETAAKAAALAAAEHLLEEAQAQRKASENKLTETTTTHSEELENVEARVKEAEEEAARRVAALKTQLAAVEATSASKVSAAKAAAATAAQQRDDVLAQLKALQQLAQSTSALSDEMASLQDRERKAKEETLRREASLKAQLAAVEETAAKELAGLRAQLSSLQDTRAPSPSSCQSQAGHQPVPAPTLRRSARKAKEPPPNSPPSEAEKLRSQLAAERERGRQMEQLFASWLQLQQDPKQGPPKPIYM